MRLELIYNHDSGNILVRFQLNIDEQALCIGLGESPQEAESNLRGWIDKDSELLKISYRIRDNKRFISLMKKKGDGTVIKTSSSINVGDIFKDLPPSKPASLTITHVDF